MGIQAEVRVEESCSGLPVFSDVHGQTTDALGASVGRGTCSVTSADVAQANGISYTFQQHCKKASGMAYENANLAIGGDRTHKAKLPALQRAPALSPVKPEGLAPAKNRPRPPPPARKRPTEDQVADWTLEQAP
eukprot:TRINITY_DN21565_c0_g1_i1.p2 TRINITY_DN21565_c0_g1~~TRINITY_DN21565_c0_g1_i1.p2  ORF type:complete len:134 (-),score=14.28 TRINITY_DN21565_c0_g1_i1:101-502(-)